MAQPSEIITVTIYGQKFRMRANANERERIECIAAAVDERIRSHKQQGATSDLRAAIMAAYQMGSELDELASSIGVDSNAADALGLAQEKINELLERLDTHIETPKEKEKKGK